MQHAAVGNPQNVGVPLSLGAMGVSAAGQRSAELNAQGVSPSESLLRGAASGTLEVLTEKMPLEKWAEMLQGNGKSILKNVLSQMGTEASEESASYLGNYILDRAAQDPNASFSLAELAQAAAGGAAGGLVFGGVGSLIGKMNGGSTSIDTDPSTHTPEQMTKINEYVNAVDPGLVEFVQRAAAGETNERYKLKNVSERAAQDIKATIGVDATGFQTELEPRMVEHILKRHGSNGQADSSMADVQDIARMQYVIDNYDSIEDGGFVEAYKESKNDGTRRNRNAKSVIYAKQIDGAYYVVEAVPDTKRRTAQIVSAFIQKNKELQTNAATPVLKRRIPNAQSAPIGLNVQDDSAASITAKIIAQDAAVGNPQNVGTESQAFGGVQEQGAAAETDSFTAPLTETLLKLDEQTRQAETMLPGRAREERVRTLSSMRAEVTRQLASVEQNKAAFQQAAEIATRLGARFELADLGTAGGKYENGTITINPYTAQPVRQVLVHELTHHLETSGQYGALQQKALEMMAAEQRMTVEQLRENVTALYAQNGVQLNEDGALRELTAAYCENRLFGDEQSIRALAQTDRTLFERIRQWVSDLVVRLRGTAEEKNLLELQRIYENAARTTGQQAGVGTAQYAFNDREVSDSKGLVALLRENMDALRDMDNVATVTGGELPADGKPTERVMQMVGQFGGKIIRDGFGEVYFSKSKIKNSVIGHGTGTAKLELFAAVPNVIAYGKEINYQQNWKGRGYDTYVFAGPVQYRDKTTFVTVIVAKDKVSNRYYLHEAVDENGNLLYEQNKTPETASDGNAQGARNTVTASEVSTISIADLRGKYNEQDAQNLYDHALQNGDTQTAEEILRLKAAQEGYQDNAEWRSSHNAPQPGDDTAVPLTDLTFAFGKDIYTNRAVQFYGYGYDFDDDAVRILQRVRNKPDMMVTAYRAVPTSVQDTKLRNGDWITLNKEYAEEHGMRTLNDDYRIVAEKIPARYVFANGDSIYEFGYNNGQNEVYKNAVGNAKQMAVTYDDSGNVIPLSARFDAENPDRRYSLGLTPQEIATGQRNAVQAAEAAAGQEAQSFGGVQEKGATVQSADAQAARLVDVEKQLRENATLLPGTTRTERALQLKREKQAILEQMRAAQEPAAPVAETAPVQRQGRAAGALDELTLPKVIPVLHSFKSCPREAGITARDVAVSGSSAFQVMPARSGHRRPGGIRHADKWFQVMPARSGHRSNQTYNTHTRKFQVMPARSGHPHVPAGYPARSTVSSHARAKRASARKCLMSRTIAWFQVMPARSGHRRLGQAESAICFVSSHARAKRASVGGKKYVSEGEVSSHARAKRASLPCACSRGA